MLVRDGHCAQCGIYVDKAHYKEFRLGCPCPDPACPSHNRAEWLVWHSRHDDLEFTVSLVDWAKLRAWVEPFKQHIRTARSLPAPDLALLKPGQDLL